MNFFVSDTGTMLGYNASRIGSDNGPHTRWYTCLSEASAVLLHGRAAGAKQPNLAADTAQMTRLAE
jgi:hypothetical protein